MRSINTASTTIIITVFSIFLVGVQPLEPKTFTSIHAN